MVLPKVTREVQAHVSKFGPDSWEVSLVGIAICRCDTRSKAKVIARRLDATLRYMAGRSRFVSGGLDAAVASWVMHAVSGDGTVSPPASLL